MATTTMQRSSLSLLLLASLMAPAFPQSGHPTPAEQKRGSQTLPTHDPQPELPPALLFEQLRRANQAIVQAKADGEATPPLLQRPAGAGRYVCAVITCADADYDTAALLGLARRDVLVLSSPGPFVSPETIALLEHCATEERLPLVLVLSHDDCRTLAIGPGKSPRQDALARRTADLRARYGALDSLPKALALAQRELIIASSDLLKHGVAADRLRILPGQVDDQTLAITWHTSRVDAMPMAPVK